MLSQFHFFFLFDSSGPNYLVEQYGLQKISLLREFCLKTGVQVDDNRNLDCTRVNPLISF